MKIYKILHKPTGLYFTPSRYPAKRNLSKTGKIYQNKPSLRYLGNQYHHPIEKNYGDRYQTRPVVLDEWEIVEYIVES